MLIKILQFLPVIIFFVSYKTTSDLILATSLIIGSVLVCSALEYLVTKTVSRLQIFLIAAVLIFGIPTVLLKNPCSCNIYIPGNFKEKSFCLSFKKGSANT